MIESKLNLGTWDGTIVEKWAKLSPFPLQVHQVSIYVWNNLETTPYNTPPSHFLINDKKKKFKIEFYGFRNAISFLNLFKKSPTNLNQFLICFSWIVFYFEHYGLLYKGNVFF